MKNGQFCEDCPLANGVVDAEKVITRGFEITSPNPGFVISFAEKDNTSVETNRIYVNPPDSGVASSWPQETAKEIIYRAENCEEPTEIVKGRLGGLLGSRAVTRCGAFPDQNPNRVQITPHA